MTQFKSGSFQSLNSAPNGSRKGSLRYTSNSKAKATTISPPTQEIDRTKSISHHRPQGIPKGEDLLNVSKSPSKNRNKNKNPLSKISRKRHYPMDNLSLGGSSLSHRKQRKFKNAVEVATVHSSQSDFDNDDVFDFDNVDSPPGISFKHPKHSRHLLDHHSYKKKEIKNSDEVSNLLATVKNTENFISDMDELKKTSSDYRTRRTANSDRLDALLDDGNDSIVDDVIDDIEGLKRSTDNSVKSILGGDKSEMVEAVRQKYEKEFPELNPEILDKDAIIIRNHHIVQWSRIWKSLVFQRTNIMVIMDRKDKVS
ncbi:unnamed protein product [Ambrosiozyma monospora]|uniref:Unnamed protein product n=1 Tax=Ambrosiozyma monospora TaxID=43982 RepID=A0ACB5TZH6_AMBMO|nr:unnamed protein product [Ambrosiozyma monospora]